MADQYNEKRRCPSIPQCKISKLPLRIVVSTGVYVTLFAGAVFGWGPMQLMLESYGAYSHKCSAEEVAVGIICKQQTISLLRIPIISGLLSILSPFLGHVADHHGPSVLMHIMGIFGCLGISLMMVAAISGKDWILFPAFSLLYLMLMSGSIMITKTGLLFEGHQRRRVISFLNALLDAGSTTYLFLLKALQGIPSATFVQVMGGYLYLAMLCFGTSSYQWNKLHNSLKKKDSSGTESVEDTKDIESNEELIPVVTSARKNEEKTGSNEECDTDINGQDYRCCPNDNYIPIRKRTASEQLRSELFLLLLSFYTFNGLRNIFTLTTARDFLAHIGDNEHGNKYLSLFTLLTAVSVLGQPGIDFVLKNYGYGVGMQVVCSLGLIHGIIVLGSSNLNVQVVGFVIFSFYRGFLFSVVFSFLATFLSEDVVGKGAGIMSALSAVLKFINLPLADWAVTKQSGNFFWPYFIYTIGVLPCFVMAWRMNEIIQHENEVEQYTSIICHKKYDSIDVKPSHGASLNQTVSTSTRNYGSVRRHGDATG